jgi:lipid II:glycine glycyltransferase (peptidoglycan interpeptide bridge formation enzyme)
MDDALISPTEWDNYLTSHGGHLLQSWAWGELKSRFGWTPHRLQVAGAAAQILFRRLPLGQTIAYIPKGPVLDWREVEQGQALLEAIHAEAQRRRAIFLKVEPFVWLQDCPWGDQPAEQAAAFTEFLNHTVLIPAEAIQPQTSIIVDISGDEEAILAAMKQKTRYNIRLAERKGVVIRRGTETDLPLFYHLSQLTSARDGFGIHSLAYYQAAFHLFSPNRCVLLIAEYEDKPLAALIAFRFGRGAYYFYGASANSHRQLMPTYLIQWAAIRWAKQQGCTYYDLWGVPGQAPATLEAEFSQKKGGLWGVYRFKRGFGGTVLQSVGARDQIYKPQLYKLYRLLRDRRSQKSLPKG